jgi:transposase
MHLKSLDTSEGAHGSKRWHAKAFRYYCYGLNSKELAKLFDVSYRTVQGLMSRENWKERRDALQIAEAKEIEQRVRAQIEAES